MIPVGSIIRGSDLAQVLQGEQGKFLAASPGGELYAVTCQRGHSITSLEQVSAREPESVGLSPAAKGQWSVKKVAELETIQT